MVIFKQAYVNTIARSYTASVFYWLAPMYVEYSARVLTFNVALNMFTMLVILRRCIN